MQRRTVHTPNGMLDYTLERKRVKNLNLRLRVDGEVHLSVPVRCTLQKADAFVCIKSGWIAAHVEQLLKRKQVPLLPELGREACVAMFREDLEQVLPLVASFGVFRPEIRVRKMRSQWGNCHWAQGYVTLNLALHRCPEHLRRYVVLHELVHFLHHDHGSGFYAVMEKVMPEWKNYRRELKNYAAAIGQ